MDRRQMLSLIAAVVVALGGLGLVAVLVLVPRGDPPAAPPEPAPPPTTTEAPRQQGVVVVKIDNERPARPQTGLAAADVVYVEPIEGGATRLVAVYSAPPDVVGPVRSVRESDVDLLAQYGQPVLAFSGAAPELRDLVEQARLVPATELETPKAFFRDRGRAKPHNLYVRPARLPEPPPTEVEQVLRFGPAPAGGEPVTEHVVRYPSATYTFRWLSEPGRWSVALDGRPMESTEAGRIAAATVVVQHVTQRPGLVAEDAAGAPSPVVETVGEGPAEILRDGARFAATWFRPSATEPTRFTTADGTPLPLAEGPVWVLLVPR
ncbi:Protein of unknown function [Amycolatopsis arida]|uniref:DUF3048 domain-containing protein n=1 Tax=Amycolatopsis arida TaxID=587909 RepID=A0A1I5YXS9_9PSEU|nr:DUF3048 domain-containing protein [Amycolatopsis arida]TDX89965.1 Protein of unknown function (DUF3048) [Amycolatopsis arida]SFQ49048.1 Protein of unknown function [Amycolatopsis arida]